MEKQASMTVMRDDQADSATDGVKHLLEKRQNYLLTDIVQDNKGHPAYDLHQSSSSN